LTKVSPRGVVWNSGNDISASCAFSLRWTRNAEHTHQPENINSPIDMHTHEYDNRLTLTFDLRVNACRTTAVHYVYHVWRWQLNSFSIYNVDISSNSTETVFLVASSWHPRKDVRNKSCVLCSWTLENDNTRTNGQHYIAAGRLPTNQVSACKLDGEVARHARLVADVIARMSRGCYAENGPLEFKRYRRTEPTDRPTHTREQTPLITRPTVRLLAGVGKARIPRRRHRHRLPREDPDVRL